MEIEKIEFENEYLIAPIRSMKFHPTNRNTLYLISGTIMYIYEIKYENEPHKLLKEIEINSLGENLHGIEIQMKDNVTRILIYGKKKVYLMEQEIEREGNELKIKELGNQKTYNFEDWIFCASFLPNDLLELENNEKIDSNNLISIGYCHNYIEIWDLSSVKRIYKIFCETRCIVYCMKFYFNFKTKETTIPLLVASGTVFNNTILWDPFSKTKSSLCVLDGHKGVLFSVNFSKDGNYLSSTSDDRSINLYQLSDLPENKILKPSLTLVYHTARIWNSSFTDNSNHLLSCSEDSKCVIWKLEKDDNKMVKGEPMLILEGHQGKNCWCFDFFGKDEKFFVLTGGGDGSVRFWSTSLSNKNNQEIKIIEAPSVKDQPVPTTSKNKTRNNLNKTKMMKNMKKLTSIHFIKERVYITTAMGLFSKKISSIFEETTQEWESDVIEEITQQNNNKKPNCSNSNNWSDFMVLGWSDGNCTLIDTSTEIPHKQITWKSCKTKICSVFEIPSISDSFNTFKLRLSNDVVSSISKRKSLFVFTFEYPFTLKLWEVDSNGFEKKETTEIAKIICTFEDNQNKSFQITKLDYSVSHKLLFLGDSNGYIKIFRHEGKEGETISDCITFNAHKERVTDLIVIEEKKEYVKFLSTGSEGDISTYIASFSNKIECERINHTKGCNVMANVGMMIPFQRNQSEKTDLLSTELLLYGFVGRLMYLWNTNHNYLMASTPFGGFKKISGMSFKNDLKNISFLFAYNSTKGLISFHKWNLQNEFYFPLVRPESHGLPLNVTKFVTSSFSSDTLSSFITTGEDGRILIYHLSDMKKNENWYPCFKQYCHKGSIRAMSICSNGKNDYLVSSDPFITFLWKISEGGRELNLLGSFVENKNELCRIMANSLHPCFNEKGEKNEDLILVVCKSDRTIKIYKISSRESTNNKITPSLMLNIDKAHPTTILSISALPLSFGSKHLVFTSSADAQFSVWILETDLSKVNLDKQNNLFHFLASFKSTSAAVNCIDCKFVSKDLVLVTTGGDDESIHIHLLKLLFTEYGDSISSLSCISSHHFPFSARSAIKSIRICFPQPDSCHIISLGSDQRIYLWKSIFFNSKIDLNLISSSFVYINNIESMDVSEDKINKKVYIVVIGQGSQVLSLNMK